MKALKTTDLFSVVYKASTKNSILFHFAESYIPHRAQCGLAQN